MATKQSAGTDVDLVDPHAVTRVRPIAEGRLAITEATSSLAGAASPFGDDLVFPMPVSKLTYVHPSPDAFPQHL